MSLIGFLSLLFFSVSYSIIINRDTKLKQGTIIRPYTPSGTWLSKQWKGTILQFVWPLVVRMMVLTTLFGLIVSFIIGDMVSYDADHVLLDQLELIGGWWSMYVSYLSPLHLDECSIILNLTLLSMLHRCRFSGCHLLLPLCLPFSWRRHSSFGNA